MRSGTLACFEKAGILITQGEPPLSNAAGSNEFLLRRCLATARSASRQTDRFRASVCEQPIQSGVPMVCCQIALGKMERRGSSPRRQWICIRRRLVAPQSRDPCAIAKIPREAEVIALRLPPDNSSAHRHASGTCPNAWPLSGIVGEGLNDRLGAPS